MKSEAARFFESLVSPHDVRSETLGHIHGALFPRRLSCYIKVYLSRRQYPFLMEEHTSYTKNRKERNSQRKHL